MKHKRILITTMILILMNLLIVTQTYAGTLPHKATIESDQFTEVIESSSCTTTQVTKASTTREYIPVEPVTKPATKPYTEVKSVTKPTTVDKTTQVTTTIAMDQSPQTGDNTSQVIFISLILIILSIIAIIIVFRKGEKE